MAEYIDRQAFLEEQRHLYCENCEKRKSIKRGKMQFVYEIGDAPCRSCGYGDVLDNLEGIPAADVRPVVFCRNCKWTKTDGMEDPAIYCEKWDRWEMPPDGFCWLGISGKSTEE